MATWALKYRPKQLSEILGQELPVRIIRGALLGVERPNTWLLQGPWGSGKTSTARILAKALVCKTPLIGGESCGICDQCVAIDKEASPNFSEVDAASYGRVEDIRELIEEARLSPIDAPARAILLDEAHMLTRTSQNVLLKTLEDGVGMAKILLVTTDPEKLLPTIRSRSVRVNLSPVDKMTVVKHLKRVTSLEGVEAEETALQLIVEHTYGHIRDALNMAQQLSFAGSITLEAAKMHLNLHLDDHAALLICKSGDDWEAARSEIESLAQENAPEEVWFALRRSVIQATLHHVSPQKEKLGESIRIIAERYGSRLSITSEWILGSGTRLLIRTVPDLVVGLAILREKLGANIQTREVLRKKLGIPNSQKQATNFGKRDPQLGVEELAVALMLRSSDDEA